MNKKSILAYCIFALLGIRNLGAQSIEKPDSSFLKKVEIRLRTGVYGMSSSPKMNYLPDRTLTFYRSHNIGWDNSLEFKLSERLGFNIGFRVASGSILSDSSVISASAAQGERDLFQYNFQFWEVPFSLRYYLLTGKIKFYLEGGASLNKFSRFSFSKTKFAPWTPIVGENATSDEVSKPNWGYEAGPGIVLDLSSRLGLSFYAKYQLAEYYWRFTSREIIMQRILLGFGVSWVLKETALE